MVSLLFSINTYHRANSVQLSFMSSTTPLLLSSATPSSTARPLSNGLSFPSTSLFTLSCTTTTTPLPAAPRSGYVPKFLKPFQSQLKPGPQWKKYLTTLQITQFIIDLFIVFFASTLLFFHRYTRNQYSDSAFLIIFSNSFSLSLYSHPPSPISSSSLVLFNYLLFLHDRLGHLSLPSTRWAIGCALTIFNPIAYSHFAVKYGAPAIGDCAGSESAALFGCGLLGSYLLLFIAYVFYISFPPVIG